MEQEPPTPPKPPRPPAPLVPTSERKQVSSTQPDTGTLITELSERLTDMMDNRDENYVESLDGLSNSVSLDQKDVYTNSAIRHFSYTEILQITRDSIKGDPPKRGMQATVFFGEFDAQPVVVKRTSLADSGFFTVEVNTLEELDSPYIVKLVGICDNSDDGFLYAVYERMGKTLEDALKDPLSLTQSIAYTKCIAAGIDYLVNLRDPLYHLDLHPLNILVNKADSIAKIIDFGKIDRVEANRAENTKFHAFVSIHDPKYNIREGSWMSPEVNRDLLFNGYDMVYSIGVMMILMINSPLLESVNISDLIMHAKEAAKKKTVPQYLTSRPLDAVDMDIGNKFFSLAIACLTDHRFDRPAPSKVVTELYGLEQELNKTEGTKTNPDE